MPPTPCFSPQRIRCSLVHLQQAKPSGPNPLLVQPKHCLTRPDWCPHGLYASAGSTRGPCATTSHDAVPGLIPTFAIFMLLALPLAFWCTEAQLACHTSHPRAHTPPALSRPSGALTLCRPLGLPWTSVMVHSAFLLACMPHAPACVCIPGQHAPAWPLRC